MSAQNTDDDYLFLHHATTDTLIFLESRKEK